MADWQRVARLLRAGRGRETVTDAAHRAALSRGWWQNAESGTPKHIPEADKLVSAADAVGVDIREILAAAGYEDEQEWYERIRDTSGERDVGARQTAIDRLEERINRTDEVVEGLARELEELAKVVRGRPEQGSDGAETGS